MSHSPGQSKATQTARCEGSDRAWHRKQHVLTTLAGQGTSVAGRGMRRACFSSVLRSSRMKGWFLIRNTPVSMPARSNQEPLTLPSSLPPWFPSVPGEDFLPLFLDMVGYKAIWHMWSSSCLARSGDGEA